MKAAVIGGDARFAYLAKLLCERGVETCAVGLEGAGVEGTPHAAKEEIACAQWLILNAPLKMEFAEERIGLAECLQLAGSGKNVIFAGPQTAPVSDGAFLSTYDLSRNEDFLRANAVLTAEGAVCAAMNSGPDALRNARCLVIGWGRIGSALAKMLAAFGADVTLTSRSGKNRRAAQDSGARAVDTACLTEVLPEMDVIFSTPPIRVLDEKQIACTRKDVRILDLSGAPYGVDLDAARKLERRAWREPGLPGRYCPRSAAEVLAESVLALMREKGGVGDG